MKVDTENKTGRAQGSAAERRQRLEQRLRERIKDKREFVTSDFRSLAPASMVRARLRAMSHRGEIVRVARDRWINDTHLSDAEAQAFTHSVATRKGVARAARPRPRPRPATAKRPVAPVSVRHVSELSLDERAHYGFESMADLEEREEALIYFFKDQFDAVVLEEERLTPSPSDQPRT